MSTPLLDAALILFKRGWMCHPLVEDSQGFPKRPIVPQWTQLQRYETILRDLPWERAKGLGIILGPVSSNLAVLDLDDLGLATAAFTLCQDTRCVRTVRGRGHIYYREAIVSASSAQSIEWPLASGSTVKVELKAQGTQVAAPPTPGYILASRALPRLVPSIGVAWTDLAHKLGVTGLDTHDGYPRPWQEVAPNGDRNKEAFIEAHMLREAGMALPLALRYMRIRWELDYERGEQEWGEVERTIKSAYRKARGKGFV